MIYLNIIPNGVMRRRAAIDSEGSEYLEICLPEDRRPTCAHCFTEIPGKGKDTFVGWRELDSQAFFCLSCVSVPQNKNWLASVRRIVFQYCWVVAPTEEEAREKIKEGAYLLLEEPVIEDPMEDQWEISANLEPFREVIGKLERGELSPPLIEEMESEFDTRSG